MKITSVTWWEGTILQKRAPLTLLWLITYSITKSVVSIRYRHKKMYGGYYSEVFELIAENLQLSVIKTKQFWSLC